jgi:tRNA-2-methylthio-N6-dimethylallyladenosine synthase
MNKKLYIQTHGCQMNEYDSSRMGDLLAASHQLELTSNPEEADVLLLNTCSIREKAEEKVFHQLGRWKRLKQQRPELIIGVGGCVASQEGAALRKRAPHVDLVFGPQTLHRLPEMIDRQRRALLPVVDVSFPEIEKFDLLPDPGANGPTASVSIMEGCSKYCSFCVVPYTRGEEISRPFDDVVAEVFHLAQQGVREVTLLGQNVNAYRGRTHLGELADLAELLHYVAAIDGIERIRFTTSHPLEMSDSLIAAYATLPKLAPHLHLPVQSGSDRILARMKRNYTAADYLAIIDRLKAACPDIQLSSDFIVGFPGEEEADFEATLDLIRQVGFDQSFSFIYSPRPGTPAAELPDSVPLEVKSERLARLQALINQQAQAISAAMLGSQQSILVSGPAKRGEGELCGRTGNNRVVNFPASDVGLIGRMANVEIVEVLPNSLRGRLL